MTSQTSEILQATLAARIADFDHYQLNITNYEMAIDHIDGMSEADQEELKECREELTERLRAERDEQKKTAVMLAVIKKQVEA